MHVAPFSLALSIPLTLLSSRVLSLPLIACYLCSSFVPSCLYIVVLLFFIVYIKLQRTCHYQHYLCRCLCPYYSERINLGIFSLWHRLLKHFNSVRTNMISNHKDQTPIRSVHADQTEVDIGEWLFRLLMESQNGGIPRITALQKLSASSVPKLVLTCACNWI